MTETQNEQNVQTFRQTPGTNPISMEQNVQPSTSDLYSVGLSTNASETQTQSEDNIKTENNIPVEENQSNDEKKKFIIIGKRCIISGLILIFI